MRPVSDRDREDGMRAIPPKTKQNKKKDDPMEAHLYSTTPRLSTFANPLNARLQRGSGGRAAGVQVQ